MSDKVTKAWNSSDINGKLLITGIIVLLIFVSAYVWDKVENSRMLSAIESMLEEQAKIEAVKKCVKENYDSAEEQWRETKGILGQTMENNGFKFPNELNTAFMKYDEKRMQIKDCLIFPEEN